MFLYLLVSLSALSSSQDFTNSRPPFQSCLGTASKLYLGMALLYALGCALTHFSRFSNSNYLVFYSLLLLRLMAVREKLRRRGHRAKETEEGVQLR